MYKQMKCRKCRQILFNQEECAQFINAHNDKDYTGDCGSVTDEKLVFITESTLPEWIREPIEQEQWSKGKVNCPSCNARIGAFDFISGIKCECDSEVLPAVHFIKSKVDLTK